MAGKEKIILQLDGEINLKADKAKQNMQELKNLLNEFKNKTIDVKAQTRSARMSIQNLGDFISRTFNKDNVVKLSTADAQVKADRLLSTLRSFKDFTKITLSLDAKGVSSQLQSIRNDLNFITGKHTISLNATTAQVKSQLAGLSKDINNFKNVSFTINVKNNADLKGINTFTKDMSKLAGLKSDITFGITVKSVQNSLDRVRQVSNVLANLKNNNSIQFTESGLNPILGKLKNMELYLRSIKQNSKIKISAEGAKELPKLKVEADQSDLFAVEKRLAIITNQIRRINRMTLKVNARYNNRSGGGGSRGGGGSSSQNIGGDRWYNSSDATQFIHFLGRSSKGLGSFGEALADVLAKGNAAGGSLSKLTGSASIAAATIGGMLVAGNLLIGAINTLASALGSIAQLVATALKPGFELMAQRDTTMLTTKAALKTSATVNGRAVTNEEATAESAYLFSRAMQEAAKTVLNLNDILTAQQGVLPMLLNKGMTPKQAQDVIFGVAGVAKTGRLAPNQVLQETRDLAQGSITARTSQVANILGITNQDLAQFKGNVDALYEYLMKKFQEYTKVMEEYANTPVGAIEQLQETWGIAAMTIVDEYGPLIVETAQTITKSLGQFDEQGNFHLSDWLKELADGLLDIVVYATSCADALLNMIQSIVGGSDPIETMVNFIKDMIGALTTLTGTLLGVIKIFKMLWAVMKSGVSLIEGLVKGFIGLTQAFLGWVNAKLGNESKANEYAEASKTFLNESKNAFYAFSDVEGQYNNTIDTGWTGNKKTNGFDTYLGESGKLTKKVIDLIDRARNRDIPKGRDVPRMKGTAQDKEDEKARKKAIQLDQKRLKDHLAKLKEILQDSLDRLKDLLEKNEVSYKEGFTGLKEYLERKTELERQQAELELKYAQDEMKAIQETMFNTPYEKSKAEHDTQRKIDKYTKALGKAVNTQEAVKRDLGNFTHAFTSASNGLLRVLAGRNNVGGIPQLQPGVQADISADGWQDFGDSLVNIAMYVSKKTGIEAKLLWAQMMHETGGDYKNQNKYYDHNYSGISVFDGAYNSQGLQRMARPASEGGWYERYGSDKEFAEAFIRVLMQSRYQKTGGIANMRDESSYAHALKVGGYYTDLESNYASSLSSWLKQAPDFSKFNSAIQSSVDGLGQQVGVQLTTSITGALELALGKDGGNLLYKQMPHLTEGCVEAVVTLGSYFNDLLLAEAKKGTNNVDILTKNLREAGVQYEDYTPGQTILQPGDVLVNNNGNHVMLVLDKDHVVGNSSTISNPVYGGKSGIVKDELAGWHTNTAVGVLRTGTTGVNLGGSAILLEAAHLSKEEMENFNLMQELLNKYNDVVSSINDEIFGNMPMLEVKLRSLFEQLHKVSRSKEPQDVAMADALRTRIRQETNKIVTDALNKQLDFNLSRISTTGSYLATEIAYGKNSYLDIPYDKMADKYYDFLFKPTNFDELKSNIANTKNLVNILDNPEKFYDSYMDINNKLWDLINKNNNIWGEYTGRLGNIQIDETKLQEMRDSGASTEDINSQISKIAKEKQELDKFISDSTNAGVISSIKQLEFQHNKLKQMLSDNGLSKDSIESSSELYKQWKKANDELWEMMNVEDKRGTTEQINAKLEEVKSLLNQYNNSREDTDKVKNKLKNELASLETELNLAKQRPANQIEELNKQFVEATNLGNTNLAEEIRGKLIDSYNKLKSVYDSWISAINSRFDAMKEYFDILPMTNLQRERGEEELTAYRNQQLAVGYRANLSKYRQRLSEIQTTNNANKAELKSLQDSGLPESAERIKYLGAEIARTNEEERYWNQTIIETKQRLRISEELAKLPTLLEKTRRVAKQALEDGLVTFLTDGVNEAENLGEALRNLAIDFLKTMQQFFAKQMVTSLMNHWFPVKTGDTDEHVSTLNLAPGEYQQIVTIPIVTAIDKQTQQLLGNNYFSGGASSSIGTGGEGSVGAIASGTVYSGTEMPKLTSPAFGEAKYTISGIDNFNQALQANTQSNQLSAQVSSTLVAATQANSASTQLNTSATQIDTTATQTSTLATQTDTLATQTNTVASNTNTASTNNNTVAENNNTMAVNNNTTQTQMSGMAGGVGSEALGVAGAGSSVVSGFKGLGGGGLFNGGIFQNLLGTITDFVGSAFGQLAGDFLAIKSIFSGDTKEKLLGTIFLETQLLYIGQQQQIIWLQQIATRLATISAGFGLAKGGYISGQGTSTSDSIPTMLSNGEYVIKASSVKKYGTNFLNAVNSGNFTKIKSGIPHYAQGGLVSDLAQEQTARGISNFGKDISSNISNTANISVALVRDEQEGMKQLLRSPEGQRIMLDFSRRYASVTSRF